MKKIILFSALVLATIINNPVMASGAGPAGSTAPDITIINSTITPYAQSQSDLLSLPTEVILYILQFCSHSDLGRFAQTCQLARNIAYDPSLWRHLRITKNSINSIGSILRLRSGVRDLDLSNSHIGNKGAIALAQALPTLAELQRLNIEINDICTAGIGALAVTLPSLTRLEYLNIGGADIDPYDVPDLAPALQTLTLLKTLVIDIGPCNRVQPWGDKTCTALATALHNLTGLKRLELYILDVELNDVAHVTASFTALTELEGLFFSCDLLYASQDQADLLITPLQGLTSLKELIIEKNHIGDSGAAAIARILPSLTRLTSLDLNTDEIGTGGGIAIARALPALPKLTSLNLGDNKIGTGGGIAIARALPALSELTSLNLGYNKIGDDGAIAIARALPTLPKLTSLNLGFNKIGTDGFDAIAQTLPRVTKLIY